MDVVLERRHESEQLWIFTLSLVVSRMGSLTTPHLDNGAQERTGAAPSIVGDHDDTGMSAFVSSIYEAPIPPHQ